MSTSSALASSSTPSSVSSLTSRVLSFVGLEDNPYFSAGFALGVAGTGLAAARGAGRGALTLAQRHLLVTLEVTSKDKSYPWVLQWLTQQAAPPPASDGGGGLLSPSRLFQETLRFQRSMRFFLANSLQKLSISCERLPQRSHFRTSPLYREAGNSARARSSTLKRERSARVQGHLLRSGAGSRRARSPQRASKRFVHHFNNTKQL